MVALAIALLLGSLFPYLVLFKEGRRFTVNVVAMQAQGSGTAMTHLLQKPVQPECTATGSIVLVTLAGNEYHMPANLEHYEDFEQLEDDVVNFLPSVANIEVFGCEIDLIRPDTRLPLRDPIQATLRKHNRFQVVVKPCIEVTFGSSKMITDKAIPKRSVSQ